MSQNFNVKSENSNVSSQSFRSYGTNECGNFTKSFLFFHISTKIIVFVVDDGEKRNLDLLFHHAIGDFGRWQFQISLLMSLLKFPIAWFQLGIVFLAPPTEFWCKQPDRYKHLPVSKWRELIAPSVNDSRHHVIISCFHTFNLTSIIISFNFVKFFP